MLKSQTKRSLSNTDSDNDETEFAVIDTKSQNKFTKL